MSGWKDLLIDTLKLTDEVKRLNRDIERIETHLLGIDKRVVRIETLVEMAEKNRLPPS